jgi:hypothetical protein
LNGRGREHVAHKGGKKGEVERKRRVRRKEGMRTKDWRML